MAEFNIIEEKKEVERLKNQLLQLKAKLTVSEETSKNLFERLGEMGVKDSSAEEAFIQKQIKDIDDFINKEVTELQCLLKIS